MAQPHPIELRQRLIEAYERGEGGYVLLARRFAIGEATAKRWVWRYHKEGHVQPRAKGGGVRSDVSLEELEMIFGPRWTRQIRPVVDRSKPASRAASETADV